MAMFRYPSSPDTMLSAEVVHAFGELDMQHSWLATVPSYIGSHASIDACARAVVAVQQYLFRRDPTSLKACIRQNVKAVSTLRSRLDTSDFSLMSVALLVLFEDIFHAGLSKQFPHLRGFMSIIEARPTGQCPSDLRRALTYCGVVKAFQVCVGLGIPSPWDEERWLRFDPTAGYGVQQTPTDRLRLLVYQLGIRLPRLITEVRKLHTGQEPYSLQGYGYPSAQSAELVDVHDTNAESEALHRVRVVLTKDLVKRAVMPCSYEFDSYEDCEAALYYWFFRIVAIQLRITLHTNASILLPGTEIAQQSPPTRVLTDADVDHHKAEQIRLAANIVMAWHTKHSNQIDPKFRQIILMALWGALSGVARFRNVPSSAVRSWVLRTFRELSGHVTVDAIAMDQASHVLQGGPRVGLLAIDTETDSEDLKVFRGWLAQREQQHGGQLPAIA